MNPALWGALSALSLGTSDFAARFSARKLGADVVFAAVVLVGAVLLSFRVWIAGTALVWDGAGAWLVAVSGVSTALMTVLLYTAIARGPVSVVAPIVAAHPVLVLAFWVVTGARPSAAQWLAMGVAIAGALVVARAGRGASSGGHDRAGFRTTLAISGTACLLYAVMVVAGQSAVPVYGELETLWLSRLVSLAFMTGMLAVRRKVPHVPFRWWPFLVAQGCLDAGGYLLLFAGSHGPGREIAAVTASAFGVVTTLWARMVLREAVSLAQWGGIAMVFAGIIVLAAP